MKNLINGLFEEYRIVQNKIDKIADFELKVRGWCITLESAIIISLMSGKIVFLSSFHVIALMIFVILVLQFLEQEQLETKKILSKRALIIEQAIDRLLVVRDENDLKKKSINKNVFKLLKGSPRTAIDLKNFGRNRTLRSLKSMFSWKNHIFYYAQYCAIIALTILSLIGYWNVDSKNPITDTKTINITCVKTH
ncbi:MAG: hypothetical protein C0613_13225 [Desulfobulbaceae bacterium]|nr:MAG: hypothetical protein C0613_13225 [Desulfobulbaceae bacterium]